MLALLFPPAFISIALVIGAAGLVIGLVVFGGIVLVASKLRPEHYLVVAFIIACVALHLMNTDASLPSASSQTAMRPAMTDD